MIQCYLKLESHWAPEFQLISTHRIAVTLDVAPSIPADMSLVSRDACMRRARDMKLMLEVSLYWGMYGSTITNVIRYRSAMKKQCCFFYGSKYRGICGQPQQDTASEQANHCLDHSQGAAEVPLIKCCYYTVRMCTSNTSCERSSTTRVVSSSVSGVSYPF